MFDLMNLDQNRGHNNRNDVKSPKEKGFGFIRKISNPQAQQTVIKELETINFNEKDDIKKEAILNKLIKLTNNRLKSFNQKIKRDFKTSVELYAMFLKISEIENIKQRFQAEVYIEATWEDNTIQYDKDQFDPHKYWIPDLFIENAIGAVKQDIKYKIIRKNNKTYVCEMRNVKGVFYETLELNDFPLDIQDVTITVTSNRSTDEIEFELSTEKQSEVNVESFRMKQEWKLYSILFTKTKEYTDLFKKCQRPGFSFSGKIARRPGYYLNNAYLLMFFITSLGFMPFSFAVTQPSTRIGSTVMLILSSINFKIAVTTRLPTVSYLTVLDKYGMTALIYLAILCFYHSIIGSSLFSSVLVSSLIQADKVCLGIFGGLFILFHFCYIPYFVAKFLAHKYVEPKTESKTEYSGSKSDENNIKYDGNRTVSVASVMPQIEQDFHESLNLNLSLDAKTFNEISSQTPRESISSQSRLFVKEIKVKPKMRYNNPKK